MRGRSEVPEFFLVWKRRDIRWYDGNWNLIGLLYQILHVYQKDFIQASEEMSLFWWRSRQWKTWNRVRFKDRRMNDEEILRKKHTKNLCSEVWKFAANWLCQDHFAGRCMRKTLQTTQGTLHSNNNTLPLTDPPHLSVAFTSQGLASKEQMGSLERYLTESQCVGTMREVESYATQPASRHAENNDKFERGRTESRWKRRRSMHNFSQESQTSRN